MAAPVAYRTPRPGARTSSEIEGALAHGSIRSLYQPLVDLYSNQTIGYEALARGPLRSAIERPRELFEAAAAAGRERELEWQCQRAALEGAIATPLEGRALFLNVEPRLLGGERPRQLQELTARAVSLFPVFVEFTERSLTDRPAELLATARRLRSEGIGIALDDVGADPRSLALMPILAPDVIKLDLRLVQENPSGQVAEIVHAVNAEAERTGAHVLAEGIETEEHRRTALALGAQYGQGWLFGRPEPLRRSPAGPSCGPIRRPNAASRAYKTPFDLVTSKRDTRRGTKTLLLALSRQLEAQASTLGSTALMLSTFQEAAFFTAPTAARYREIASNAALAGALGVGLPEIPAPGVRGVALDDDDPLRGEWNVAVIGPHFAAAFVARDLGDRTKDMDRRFDFALTYERSLAIEAAGAMISRLAPLPE
jgi:EAL domain-containing protein (putative c-di-GMP-specific phosphodiesterase class I)